MQPKWQDVINKYYPAGSRLRDIYICHCKSVAEKALAIANRNNLNLDRELIETAAMLHDIGIVLTDAPGIECFGNAPYIAHGYLGAQLLEDEGFIPEVCRVAKCHTGAGISNDDIKELQLPIPPGDYMPHTLLERLICYADKFYSKSGDMKEKSLQRVRESMTRHGLKTVARFEALHQEFG